MKKMKYTLFLGVFYFSFCSPTKPSIATKSQSYNTTKIDMFLNAYSVESEGFPYIQATIDFETDTNRCYVSYDDPKFKERTYSLTKQEIDTIRNILNSVDLSKLNRKYDVQKTDQPTSTIKFYMPKDTIEIIDRGLEGDYPLPSLYRIVYKLKQNFR
jgi:hypothetical protein